MYRCFYCEHELVWESDEDTDDIGYEESGIVHLYTCPHCKARYEVMEPIGDDICTT